VAEAPEGRAQAEMVLGPFAETKRPCLQGRNPAYKISAREAFITQNFVKEKANLDSRL